MVSKVAVIAIVGIIAVPILLGYALNLDQTTETGYRTTGETVNVTPMLQNEVEYTSVEANIYTINDAFTINGNNGNSPSEPIYNSTGSVKTSIPIQQYIYSDNGGDAPSGSYPTAQSPLSTWVKMYMFSNINYNTAGYLNFDIFDDTNTTRLLAFTKIVSVDWDAATSELHVMYYGNGTTLNHYSITIDNPNDYYHFVQVGTYTAEGYLSRIHSNFGSNNFADLSAGYYFKNQTNTVNLPDSTKSFIMSINLDSITASSFSQLIEIYPDIGACVARLQLTKTTIGGVVSWQVATGFSLSTITDLYYDPSRNDNTYQLYVEMSDKVKTSETQVKVETNYSLKYVGGWPTAIGSANSYISYDFTSTAYSPIANNQYNGIAKVIFAQSTSNRSPTIRMDAAIISGYEQPVIVDQTYNPGSFKDNPSTTISDVTKYGSSFTFGGNTYEVKKGNITMGTHEIPVKGIVLSSTPISGGYENKIGDTVISTTAAPSAITFNGKWSASISTTAQEEYEYTKTEWKAGEFAWDGMDQNFLMVGLLASLGAFIALGIYARRSKANIWPLLLVCGGAAMLFFVML